MNPVASAQSLEERCIDTIRFLAVDGVQKANSGHPGMPMGAAPVAYTLFTRHLRFDPADPAWPDRDRFVLSAGHACMLLYSLLHLTGYDLTLDDLRAFRQWGSRTPGHPEYGLTAGVETTTGPLGQGFANAVGMAVAERFLAATFNGDGPDVMDHFTYVLAGDGDMMEGVSSEAASFAGHQKLGKLIVLYDDNHITIDGSTDLAFTEDVCARFDAYGWHVQRVGDGNDVDGHRRGHRRGQGRDGQAVAHRRAHAHRLRLAQQAGHRRRPRRAARRRRGHADQGEPRLAARADLLRARRGEGVLRGGGATRRSRARRLERAPRGVERVRSRPGEGVAATPGRGPCPRAGTPTCRCSSPRTARSRPAWRLARSSTRWRHACRR